MIFAAGAGRCRGPGVTPAAIPRGISGGHPRRLHPAAVGPRAAGHRSGHGCGRQPRWRGSKRGATHIGGLPKVAWTTEETPGHRPGITASPVLRARGARPPGGQPVASGAEQQCCSIGVRGNRWLRGLRPGPWWRYASEPPEALCGRDQRPRHARGPGPDPRRRAGRKRESRCVTVFMRARGATQRSDAEAWGERPRRATHNRERATVRQ
jgi:hypothetical protein